MSNLIETVWTNITTYVSNLFNKNNYTMEKFKKDIIILINGFTPVLTYILSLTSLSSENQTSIKNILTSIQQNASKIINCTDDNTTTSYIKLVLNSINLAFDIVAALPLPTPYSTIIKAVAVFLPFLEAQLGILSIKYNSSEITNINNARNILIQYVGYNQAKVYLLK